MVCPQFPLSHELLGGFWDVQKTKQNNHKRKYKEKNMSGTLDAFSLILPMGLVDFPVSDGEESACIVVEI